MQLAPVGRSRTTGMLAALLLAIGLGWLYADVVGGLVRQWRTDDNYSHGFFVVPLALYFGWERRAALARAAIRPSLAGLVLVVLSLALLLAGLLSAELFLTRVSAVGVVA